MANDKPMSKRIFQARLKEHYIQTGETDSKDDRVDVLTEEVQKLVNKLNKADNGVVFRQFFNIVMEQGIPLEELISPNGNIQPTSIREIVKQSVEIVTGEEFTIDAEKEIIEENPLLREINEKAELMEKLKKIDFSIPLSDADYSYIAHHFDLFTESSDKVQMERFIDDTYVGKNLEDKYIRIFLKAVYSNYDLDNTGKKVYRQPLELDEIKNLPPEGHKILEENNFIQKDGSYDLNSINKKAELDALIVDNLRTLLHQEQEIPHLEDIITQFEKQGIKDKQEICKWIIKIVQRGVEEGRLNENQPQYNSRINLALQCQEELSSKSEVIKEKEEEKVLRVEAFFDEEFNQLENEFYLAQEIVIEEVSEEPEEIIQEELQSENKTPKIIQKKGFFEKIRDIFSRKKVQALPAPQMQAEAASKPKDFDDEKRTSFGMADVSSGVVSPFIGIRNAMIKSVEGFGKLFRENKKEMAKANVPNQYAYIENKMDKYLVGPDKQGKAPIIPTNVKTAGKKMGERGTEDEPTI